MPWNARSNRNGYSDFNKGNIACSRMIAQYALAGARGARYWIGPCSGKYTGSLHKIWDGGADILPLLPFEQAPRENNCLALGADPTYEKIPTVDLEEENQE